MNSSPYEHVKQIIDKRLTGEEKESVLAYLAHAQKEVSSLNKDYERMKQSRDDYKRKWNKSREKLEMMDRQRRKYASSTSFER